MSKMVTYRVSMPKGVVTIDQLIEIMQAMGLKPKLHDGTTEVDSFTVQDSARGNLTFDTSVLGGSARQRTGVASVRYNSKTRVLEGGLELAIDSWGVNAKADALARNMGKALTDLIAVVSKVAEATRKTSYVIPGLTAEEVTEMFLALGGRIATKTLVDGGSENENLPNLAASYLNRRQKLAKMRVPTGKETTDSNLTDLLQIGAKPQVFNVEIHSPEGKTKIRMGYVPPVAAIKKVKGGVEVTLPEIFLPGCKQQLENVRNLGIALRAAEAQAKQHMGEEKPIPHVEVRKGTLSKFQIDWEKPVAQGTANRTAQQAFAERAAAIASGEVSVSLEEQMSIMTQAEKPAAISTAALKDQVIQQARDAGIAQFVYA